MNKRFYFVVLCCIFLIFYFSRLVFTPKLVLMENVNADELLVKTNKGHPYLVMTRDSKVLILNKTTNETLFALTFKEPESGYKFLSDGLLLYGYYPEEFVACEIILLDYNLNVRWRITTEFNISEDYIMLFPQSSEEFNGYILMLGGIRRDLEVDKGLLLFNKSNGKLVKVIPAYGEDLKVVKKQSLHFKVELYVGKVVRDFNI